MRNKGIYNNIYIKFWLNHRREGDTIWQNRDFEKNKDVSAQCKNNILFFNLCWNFIFKTEFFHITELSTPPVDNSVTYCGKIVWKILSLNLAYD